MNMEHNILRNISLGLDHNEFDRFYAISCRINGKRHSEDVNNQPHYINNKSHNEVGYAYNDCSAINHKFHNESFKAHYSFYYINGKNHNEDGFAWGNENCLFNIECDKDKFKRIMSI